MDGFYYLIPFLVANLHSRRPARRFKFPNISHTRIIPCFAQEE